MNTYRPEEFSDEIISYISPRNHPFKTWTPLFINADAEEGLFNVIRSFSDNMSRVDDNKVMFHVSPHMPHDFLMLWLVLGTRDEAKEALSDAKKFVAGLAWKEMPQEKGSSCGQICTVQSSLFKRSEELKWHHRMPIFLESLTNALHIESES